MYQQTTLVGYVGNEPTMRYTQDGLPVTNFNVAVNNRYTTAAGESMEETIWYRITTWRRQAETCADYVHPGQLVLVVGVLKPPHVWIDDEGQAQATLELTARLVKFLSRHPQSDEVEEAIDIIDDGVVAA